MNHKAIEAGATAYVPVEVPASWAEAADAPKQQRVDGDPELIKVVETIMEPVGRMDGDLPASFRFCRPRRRAVPASVPPPSRSAALR